MWFLLLYDSASKKATAMVFITGDRGHSSLHFDYKAVFEGYLDPDVFSKQSYLE